MTGVDAGVTGRSRAVVTDVSLLLGAGGELGFAVCEGYDLCIYRAEGMGVDADYEFGSCWARGWNSVEEEGGVEVGDENKILRMERTPKPEQTSGPWLGWPTTCRGVFLNKGVGVGVRTEVCTNYVLLRLFDRPIHRGGSSWKILFPALRPMEIP